MTEKTSKSDIVRDAIQKALSENYDFSSDSKKRELKEKINTDNPNLFDKSSLDSLFSKLLPKELIKAKKDPRDYGMKTKLPKLNGLNDMNAKITPEPQADTQTAQATAQNQSQTTQTAENQTPPKDRSFTENIDEDSVGATMAALFVGVKMILPEMESLTDAEKKSLGRLWLPAAKKYLTEMQAIIVVPLLATVTMMAPKVQQARKKRKERIEKEKLEKNPEEPPHE